MMTVHTINFVRVITFRTLNTFIVLINFSLYTRSKIYRDFKLYNHDHYKNVNLQVSYVFYDTKEIRLLSSAKLVIFNSDLKFGKAKNDS